MRRLTKVAQATAGYWAAGVIGLLGCQPDFNVAVSSAALDQPFFNCQVQPILTKSCAMFACHGADGTSGTTSRFFRVYARDRLRYSGITEAQRNSALTAQERSANFVAARALVDLADATTSLLLLKPLEQQAGGYYHRGAEIYGQGNVFADRRDADFQILSKWALGAKDDPLCIEPGSNL